jgi:hypothetical protein
MVQTTGNECPAASATFAVPVSKCASSGTGEQFAGSARGVRTIPMAASEYSSDILCTIDVEETKLQKGRGSERN